MLFRLLVWFWRNAVEYPLMHLGDLGRFIAPALYLVLIYVPGMTLAFVAYTIYPPKVIVRPGSPPPESHESKSVRR